jgi:DNA polymerase III epsilon subunit-like protein
LAFDYETTGLLAEDDLPLDFGYCLVRDGQVVWRRHFLLDRTSRPDLVEPHWLAGRFDDLRRYYQRRGLHLAYSEKRLAAEGHDPLRVLAWNHKLFSWARSRGLWFVGHNAVSFDCRLSAGWFKEYCDDPWHWGDCKIFDTGVAEKVYRCALSGDSAKYLIPKSGEALSVFLRRAAASPRAGIKWNTAECVARYGLELGRDTLLHTAAVDAYVCHLLMGVFGGESNDNSGI